MRAPPQQGSNLQDDPHEVAKESGVVVLPGPRDVFVDIDNEADYLLLLAAVETARQNDLHLLVEPVLVAVLEGGEGTW